MIGRNRLDPDHLSVLKSLEKEIAPYATADTQAAKLRLLGGQFTAITIISAAIAAAFIVGWSIQQTKINELQQTLAESKETQRKLDSVLASLGVSQQRIATVEAELRPRYWYEDLAGLNYRSPWPAVRPNVNP